MVDHVSCDAVWYISEIRSHIILQYNKFCMCTLLLNIIQFFFLDCKPKPDLAKENRGHFVSSTMQCCILYIFHKENRDFLHHIPRWHIFWYPLYPWLIMLSMLSHSTQHKPYHNTFRAQFQVEVAIIILLFYLHYIFSKWFLFISN